MKKYIKVLLPIIIIMVTFSLFGCSNNKKVDELEKTVTDLQKQLSDKESTTTTAETTRASETTQSETTAPPVAEKADYSIGELGPAGGIIFYINPNYQADGWKYLEAAPSDFPGSNNDYYIQWDYREYRNHPVTGATGTAIGTGMSNTQKIVNIQGSGNYAAKLCDDLILNGYDDWFMPSKDELNLMYENLYLKNIGGFASDYCWSSSVGGADGAWIQKFDNGGQYVVDKDYTSRVRALRAF